VLKKKGGEFLNDFGDVDAEIALERGQKGVKSTLGSC